MNRNIDSIGFEMPPETVHTMSEALERIQNISPYDSYINAYAKKEQDRYLMTLLVKHMHGYFASVAWGPELGKAFDEATDDITQQIKKWRTERFVTEDTYTKLDAILEDHNMSVLIIDDDVESVTPLKICLKNLNCKVRVVSNGHAAIHEIISNDHHYDVIVLDWNMPDMNGKQTLLNAESVVSSGPFTHQHWKEKQLPFITFSGADPKNIDVPECKNFRHIEHWEKHGITQTELMSKVSKTLSDLGYGPLGWSW